MVYISQRDKVKEFFEKHVFPALEGKVLIYSKVIQIVSAETNASEDIVIEIINNYVQKGILIENRTLCFPDDKVKQIFKSKEEQIKEELKMAGL